MEKSKSLTRRGFIRGFCRDSCRYNHPPSQVVSGLGHQSPSDKLHIAELALGEKVR